MCGLAQAMRIMVPSTRGRATRSQKLGRRREGQATIGSPQRCCIARFSAADRKCRWCSAIPVSGESAMRRHGGAARSLAMLHPLATRLTESLGIRHPVLLAPMALVAGGALAGAVTAAGGLGIIAQPREMARYQAAAAVRDFTAACIP